MYKETIYHFCDRPYYRITVTQKIINNNINIEFQLAEHDDFIIEVTQSQALTIINQLASYVGKKVVDKELTDYGVQRKK